MKKHILHIDFETRSTVDLLKTGGHIYAWDKTTDALCMAYALDDGPVEIWKYGEKFPWTIAAAVGHDDVIFAAHNANFEFLIWNFVCAPKYGWPKLPLRKLDCTMVRAYSMGLPGSLEMAAKAVGMPYEKDMHGHRIMLQLCKPRKVYADGNYDWWNVEDSTKQLDIREKYEILYRYCKQDIIVERELDKRLLPLSESERELWFLDQKINFRGIHLDEQAAHKAITIVKSEQKKYNYSIKQMTKGAVNTANSHIALKNWINTYGFDCDSVCKADVLEMLEGKLPNKVRNVLLLRQEASRSSTAKLNRMLTGKSYDSRVRGCFQFYGAASTGRWAGRRIQLQNLKRPDITQSEIEDIMARLVTASQEDATDYLNIFHGSAIKPISSCIRAMLTAGPGKKLICVDFTAIEGRVLAWLAGEEKTLNIYRSHGKIYEHTASQIYKVPISEIFQKDPRRLIGKVATLALGFQGGVGAFQSMAKQYFIKITDKQAEEIRDQWRLENPNVKQYWYDLERVAIAAVQSPGQKFVCGPQGRQVIFLMRGSFLFCRLPSGRAICYPYPKIRPTKTPWGEIKNALNYKGIIYGKFVTRVAYGGLIAENITQATARDLLAEALFRFEKNNYPVIMHVHDEIVAEVDQGFGTTNEAEDIMCELPLWATDLPIKAAGWTGERYRK